MRRASLILLFLLLTESFSFGQKVMHFPSVPCHVVIQSPDNYSLFFRSETDSVLAMWFGPEKKQWESSEKINILSDAECFYLVNPDEELKTMIRTTIPPKTRQEFYDMGIRLEIMVLLDTTGRVSEVYTCVESDKQLDPNGIDWVSLVRLETAVKEQVFYEDDGRLERFRIKYGATKLIFDFPDGDAGVVLRYFSMSDRDPSSFVKLRYWTRNAICSCPIYSGSTAER